MPYISHPQSLCLKRGEKNYKITHIENYYLLRSESENGLILSVLTRTSMLLFRSGSNIKENIKLSYY